MNSWTEYTALDSQIGCGKGSQCEGFTMSGQYMWETDAAGENFITMISTVKLPKGKKMEEGKQAISYVGFEDSKEQSELLLTLNSPFMKFQSQGTLLPISLETALKMSDKELEKQQQSLMINLNQSWK